MFRVGLLHGAMNFDMIRIGTFMLNCSLQLAFLLDSDFGRLARISASGYSRPTDEDKAIEMLLLATISMHLFFRGGE